jgi:hypothetical protein
MGTFRHSLTEADFKTLVSGGIISIPEANMELALQDIGFDRMVDAILTAIMPTKEKTTS